MVGVGETNLDPILLPMVLCSDAVVKEGALVGDPTEGSLVVLEQKGDTMVDDTRKASPRIAKLPFDSAYKLMATFHNIVPADDEPVVWCYVKGAPDVLIGRSAYIYGSDGKRDSLDVQYRQPARDQGQYSRARPRHDSRQHRWIGNGHLRLGRSHV